MDKLKSYVKENEELKKEKVPYLKLAEKLPSGAVRGTGPHTVKLIGCEEATNKDYMTKQEVDGFEILVEENGEKKKYFFEKLGKDGKLHYLVERFADIEEGTMVILEYKKIEGTYKGYIDVKVEGEDSGDEVYPDEIPIIDEEY